MPKSTSIKFGCILLGVVTVAFVFFSQERVVRKQRKTTDITFAATVSADSSAVLGSNPQPSASVRSSCDQVDKTLALIRGKLTLLEQIVKSGKGAEDEIMTELVALLSDENAGEITRRLSAEDRHSRFGLAALQRWLEVDALAAADWVAAQKDASDEQAWAVAHELVTDGAALNRYCSRLPDNTWRQIFLKQAALAAMQQDPTRTIQLVHQISPASEQLDLLQTTICTWMNTNPAAASGWIGQVQDSPLKQELISVGAKALASNDPVGAIDWLASSLPDSSDGAELLFNKTFEDILGAWAETEPSKAASFVSRLPSGDLRKATVNLVAHRWSERDPVAAANWMKVILDAGHTQRFLQTE